MDSKLKESVIKHLEYQKTISSDPDKPFMSSPRVGKSSWTIQEIIDEVRSETEFGESFIDMIVGASIDRYCGSKIIRKYEQPKLSGILKLDGFPEVVYDGLVWKVISEGVYKISFKNYVIIFEELEKVEVYRKEDFTKDKKFPIILGPMTFKEVTKFIKTRLI